MEALKNEDLPVSQSTDEQKQANNSDDHDLYAAFASLLSDQLNVPDVKTILDTQRQMLNKKILFSMLSDHIFVFHFSLKSLET
jgi:hypothetical protein